MTGAPAGLDGMKPAPAGSPEVKSEFGTELTFRTAKGLRVYSWIVRSEAVRVTPFCEPRPPTAPAGSSRLWWKRRRNA